MSEFSDDSIFWIEVEKIQPNPFQPRREFDEIKLQTLADSIRQYGVLQPLLVTRREVEREDGGLMVEYELIAGERRWRAAQLVGMRQVPAIIKSGEQTDQMKLEMAIIENLQREDLNPTERARAFKQLTENFKMTHLEVAKKIGKSREYVSNSLRLLSLPDDILQSLTEGKITEGHARTILMLVDRPEEQRTLFQEILQKGITVRIAEDIARSIAFDRIRKHNPAVEPELIELEQRLAERLGTRVRVERREIGGKVTIDFFSNDDLHSILQLLEGTPAVPAPAAAAPEENLYNIRNFSL